MNINKLLSTWIMRVLSVVFSMVLVLFFVIASTPLNSVSIIVLWVMAFLFWVVYSGHELTVMIRVLFLSAYHKIVNRSFLETYDEQTIIESLLFFRSRKSNLWDGHLIPFMIYLVFSSMVFGFITTSIYIVVLIGFTMYLIHTLLRLWCIYIIQYTK